jgi:hypothetical protein
MDKAAKKILDTVSDMRYTNADMDHLGFHLINISPIGVREGLVIMAESIIEHNSTMSGASSGQYRLF